jgi:dTDP-glucose pyrophosphorylase
MTDNLLNPNQTLFEAIQAIESSRKRMCVVILDGYLQGTITDGDIRRSFLSGGNLETKVSDVMNKSPVVAEIGKSKEYLFSLMKNANVMAIPLIDHNRFFVRIVHLTDISFDESRSLKNTNIDFAVIMAGGEGLRLRPITEEIPKPMVNIGGLSILERQLMGLRDWGIGKVYISVNYLAHIIEDYFGNGESLGLNIHYLKEPTKMGTGGSLSLLPSLSKNSKKPILVMNGDILTASDFNMMSQFHDSTSSELTVCAINYHVKIPFGVIYNEAERVKKLVEKPSQNYLCNAGIYLVSPSILQIIPKGEYFNMTDLVDLCLAQSRLVSVFPIHEYWSDVGTTEDLDKARELFSKTYM